MWPLTTNTRLFQAAKYCLTLLVVFVLVFGLYFGCLVYAIFLGVIHLIRIKQAPKEHHLSVIKPKNDKRAPNDFQLIGHRGGGFDAPENTIEAIREASKNGACAVEVDITFTKDGKPAIIHDDTVDRTTDGSGSVSGYTLDQLQKLDAAAKHPTKAKYGKVMIPSLEDVIKECLKLDLNIYFDCKGFLDMQRNTTVLLEMYKKYPALYKKSAVCSFFPQLVYCLHRADPNVVVGLTHRELFLTYMDDYKTTKRAPWMTPFLYVCDRLLEWFLFSWAWYICGSSLWLMHTGHVTRNFINNWKEYGIDTVVWLPNDQYERKYFGEYLKCPVIVDTLDKNYFDKKVI